MEKDTLREYKNIITYIYSIYFQIVAEKYIVTEFEYFVS